MSKTCSPRSSERPLELLELVDWRSRHTLMELQVVWPSTLMAFRSQGARVLVLLALEARTLVFGCLASLELDPGIRVRLAIEKHTSTTA